MTDKSWKPKKLKDVTAEGAVQKPLVEVSIKNPELKSTFEEIVGGIEGVRLKDSQSTGTSALIIIELDENPEETFTVIRDMGKMVKGAEIFLTAPTLDSSTLLEAMRAGAKEFLAQPIKKEEVQDAVGRFLERMVVQQEKTENVKKAGKILAFFGGKGGVGTTSIAVNLAATLQQLPDNPSVVLVDVNQHGGDLPLYLDLQPKHSFRDIAADITRLDPTFLIRLLTKCESGLQILPSGYDDLSTGRLNPECIEATFQLLQANFDYIVVDCGHVLDLTTKKTLELSSWIIVTSTLMVPVVHRTKRILELLRGSGFPASKIRLVMNRYLSSEQDVLHETEDILKQKTFWLLPNDYPTVSQAVNSGKPIIEVAPKTAVAKSYREFASAFDDSQESTSQKGVFGKWFSSFSKGKTQPASAES